MLIQTDNIKTKNNLKAIILIICQKIKKNLDINKELNHDVQELKVNNK